MHNSSVVLWWHAGASALQFDPKLIWLAPGTPPNCVDPSQIMSATAPWFQSHPSRQAFVSRLLALLVSGPFPTQQSLCQALLVVEAGRSASEPHETEPQTLAGQLDFDRARAAAKKLLGMQRTNLGMWGAYASLESQAGQYKVGYFCAFCMRAQCMHAQEATAQWGLVYERGTRHFACMQSACFQHDVMYWGLLPPLQQPTRSCLSNMLAKHCQEALLENNFISGASPIS